MAILFHEGLPRSGKSYEAVVKQLVPALAQGRKVYARVDGLSYEHLAELAGRSVEEIKNLLVVWSETDIHAKCYLECDHNALIVWDEIQNYFPQAPKPLSEADTKFFAEHGRRGLDIVLMGQDHRDCHSVIKRRIARLIRFMKRDVLGQPNSYTWTLFQPTQPEKFEKIQSGGGKYEAKYFAAYSTHVDGNVERSDFIDNRAIIWKRPVFKYGIPVFVVSVVYAIYTMVGFFGGGKPDTQKTKAAPPKVEPRAVAQASPAGAGLSMDAQRAYIRELVKKEREAQASQSAPVSAPSGAVATADAREAVTKQVSARDYLSGVMAKSRVRLAGMVYGDHVLAGVVEFLDDTLQAKDRLNFAELEALGWHVERQEYGVSLTQGDQVITVRPWPLETPWKGDGQRGAEREMGQAVSAERSAQEVGGGQALASSVVPSGVGAFRASSLGAPRPTVPMPDRGSIREYLNSVR